MDEKRRNRRFQSDQKLWCEGQELNAPAIARDISRGGMAIITDQASEVGSEINVSFLTPEQNKVSVNMEVVWRNEKSEDGQVAMGLRVVMFEKGQNAFDNFVNRHLGDDGPGAGESGKAAGGPVEPEAGQDARGSAEEKPDKSDNG